jgi:HK97 family phage portal protein
MDLRTAAGRALDYLRALLAAPAVTLQNLVRMVEGPPTTAGITVTEVSAMNYAAVWCAVQCIAGDLASLPLHLYQRVGDDGKRRMTQHPVYYLLHDRPNPMMTSSALRETIQAHVLLWGNGYLEIDRSGGGEVEALWPRMPWMVSAEPSLYAERGPVGSRYYRVTDPDGRQRPVAAGNMVHIPGLGGDGIFGYSVIRKARETIGLGLEAERFGAEFFGHATVASGVYTHPGRLSREGREALRNDLEQFRQQRLGTILLEEGTTWTQTTIPPDDAQFLQTRLFQVLEICRWFNLPPQKLKDLSRATYTNAEQQQLDYVQSCLMRWLVRWEMELGAKLIRPAERRQQFVQFTVDGILRGDFKTRYDGFAVGKQWGFLSTNDIRRLENMDPVEGGDMYLMPTNMWPVDRVDELVGAQTGGGLMGPSGLTGSGAAAGNGGPGRDYVDAEVIRRALPQRSPPEEPPPRPGPVWSVLTAAHRDLLEEAVRRLGRIEAGRARKASRSAEEFTAWIEEFYPAHAEVMVLAVRPIVQAHCAAAGGGADPEPRVRAIVTALVAEVRGVWQRLLAAAPAPLAEPVDKILRQWETERPAQLATRLLAEGGPHAAAPAA